MTSLDPKAVVRTALLGAFVSTLLLAGVGALVAGFPYYATPVDDRPEHALAAWFASGRPIGLVLGMIGAALMFTLLLYSARKWLPGLGFLGSSQTWMTVHFLCGLLGPAFIVLHAEVKRPYGFIGVGFWCMALVAMSGFFGRYLFGYFPTGSVNVQQELAERRKSLNEVRADLVSATEGAAADDVATAVQLALDFEMRAHSLGELFALDREIRRRTARIHSLLVHARLAPALRDRAQVVLSDQLALRRRGAGFDVARRLLRYWNLFHQPLALAMYLIVTVHILNAVVFGGSVQVFFGTFFGDPVVGAR